MDTDKDLTTFVSMNGIYGAGRDAIATANAEFFLDDDTTALALTVGPGRASLGTGCRGTGKTANGSKTRGETTR